MGTPTEESICTGCKMLHVCKYEEKCLEMIKKVNDLIDNEEGDLSFLNVVTRCKYRLDKSAYTFK